MGQIKLTGLMNYFETPVERAWEDAIIEVSGKRPNQPDEIDLSRDFNGEPIIQRIARISTPRGIINSEYERWPNKGEKLLYSTMGVPGLQRDGRGMFIETAVDVMNDARRFYEVVSFENGENDVYTFWFDNGRFYLSEHDAREPIPLRQFLEDRYNLEIPRRKLATQKGKEDIPDDENIAEALDENRIQRILQNVLG